MLTEHKIVGTIGMMSGIMSVPTPFTRSWGRMLLFSQQAVCQPGEYIHPADTAMSLHDSARNDLVRQMRGDWILMFDTDTEFEPDFAARLVAAMYRHNVDVLSGIYSFKSPPYLPILYMRNPDSNKHEVIQDWDRNADLLQVDAAGGGCLLVRKKVLDRVSKEFNCQPFDRDGGSGEDLSFFRRLGKLHIPVYCAWKIEMMHLAYRSIRTSMDCEPDALPQGHEYQVVGKRMLATG